MMHKCGRRAGLRACLEQVTVAHFAAHRLPEDSFKGQDIQIILDLRYISASLSGAQQQLAGQRRVRLAHVTS